MEIYTIGHGNMPLPEFMSLLVRYGIEAVIDVRSEPYSKHMPQYNKGAIEQELEKRSIKYLFLADDEVGNCLGGRPKDPECYRSGLIDYDLVKVRPWYKLWTSEVAVYAKKHRSALLCAEEDPYKCHRHNLLTQTFLSLGVTVYHIRRGGLLEEGRKKNRQVMLASFFQ